MESSRGVRITRLRLTNWKGIEELDVNVPPKGGVFVGSNGQGKTSALDGITAALAAVGVSPDKIRRGADKSEILVCLDHHFNRVRRRIPLNGSAKLSVEHVDDIDDLDAKGDPKRAPQAFLDELFERSPIDPIGLVEEQDKKKRAANVAKAMPAVVTREDLNTWAPGLLPANFDISRHGLVVVSDARKLVALERTDANKEKKRAAEEVARAQTAFDEASKDLPAVAPTAAQASEEHDAAQKALARLEARQSERVASVGRTKEQRDKIAKLREDAIKLRGEEAETLKTADEQYPDTGAFAVAQETVRLLEAELAVARETLERERRVSANRKQLADAADGHATEARRLLDQALMLEDSLAAVTVPEVDKTEIEAARARVESAAQRVATVARVEAAATAKVTLDALIETASAAEDKAHRLDIAVATLDAAPKKLIERSGGIPGLTIDGDNIYLDGVNLDDLCGAEQLRFAVELSKRACRKGRLLVIDGIERIASKKRPEFYGWCTSDGWQLLGSLVDDTDGDDVCFIAFEEPAVTEDASRDIGGDL